MIKQIRYICGNQALNGKDKQSIANLVEANKRYCDVNSTFKKN